MGRNVYSGPNKQVMYSHFIGLETMDLGLATLTAYTCVEPRNYSFNSALTRQMSEKVGSVTLTTFPNVFSQALLPGSVVP